MTIAITPPSPVAHPAHRSWLDEQPLRTEDAARCSGVPGVLPALAQATVDRHALVEATLAWQCLRPRGDEAAQITSAANRGVRAPAFLPIAYTGDDLVAGRLVRVLTGLTWAVVAGWPGDCWVGVPRSDYHRVQRALAGTWRRYRRDFAGTAVAPAGPAAAVALWRMAFLLHGRPAATEAFHLRLPDTDAVDMLCRAAHVLGAAAVTDPRPRGRRTVMICSSADVRRLLTVAVA
jgi:hypothetical protein